MRRRKLDAFLSIVAIVMLLLTGLLDGMRGSSAADAPLPPSSPARAVPSVQLDVVGPSRTPPSPDELLPEVQEARARQAIDGVLGKHLRHSGPRYEVSPIDVTVAGESAHGVAEWQDAAVTLSGPAHILAHLQSNGARQVVMPSTDGQYMQWLEAMSDTLVSASQEGQLRALAAETDALRPLQTIPTVPPEVTLAIPPFEAQSRPGRTPIPQSVPVTPESQAVRAPRTAAGHYAPESSELQVHADVGDVLNGECLSSRSVPRLAPAEEEGARSAIEAALATLLADAAATTYLDLIEVWGADDWAVGECAVIDKRDESPGSGEGRVVLARREEAVWQAALPGDPRYGEWLTLIPEQYYSLEIKQYFSPPSQQYADSADVGTLAGSSGLYRLPYPCGTSAYVVGIHGDASQLYDIDFQIYGQDIVAARSGWIHQVIESHSECCGSSLCAACNNYVVINHGDGEYSYYLHVGQWSATRNVGDWVNQGDVIARQGDVGYTYSSRSGRTPVPCNGNTYSGYCFVHLHFGVHLGPYWNSSTRQARFEDVPGSYVASHVTYQSGNCPTTPTHLECRDNYCTRVDGAGSDQCSPEGSYCGPSPGDGIELFDGTNYGGDSKVFTEGRYADLGVYGWLDRAESVRFRGSYVGNYHVVLYTERDFTGNPYHADADVPDLGDAHRNHVRSLDIYRHQPPTCNPNSDQVALYADTGYNGSCVTLSVGDYPNPGQLGSLGNDNAESIRVGSNVKAILYEHDDYLGRSETFTVDDSYLWDNSIGGNVVSSVKVQRRTQPPSAPTLQSPGNGATINEGQNITLSWSATGDEYYGEVWGGPGGTLTFGWQSGTSKNIGSQWPGHVYSWHVKARNSAGESSWSDTWTFTVKLAAPSDLAASATSCTEIDLNWSDNSGNEEGYTVYRNGAPVGQVGMNSESYQDSGLSAHTTYSYYVTAFRGGIDSDPSNTVDVITPLPEPPAFTGWGVANTVPDVNLWKIDMLSEDNSWIVGGWCCNPWISTVLHWKGTNWQDSVDAGSYQLFAVDMLDATEGWVGGQFGTLQHFLNDSWETITSPTSVSIRDIDMLSATEGWAVGHSGYPDSDGVLLHFVNGSWHVYSFLSNKGFYAIDMVSASDGWAVGGGTSSEDQSLIYHYDGASWQRVTSPSDGSVRDIEMLSSSEGWAVSGNAILRYADDTWEVVDRPAGSRYLYGLDMLSSSEGWAVGQQGTIVHYLDGVWHSEESPTTETLYDVQMTSNMDGWAVGWNGTILRYVGTSSPTGICQPDRDLSCGSSHSWNNGDSGSTDQIDSYSCSSWNESGPEYAYQFVASSPGQVDVTLSGMFADLDIFVIEESNGLCNSFRCISHGDDSATFSAEAGQTYYLVVDGYYGAVGDYTIRVNCGIDYPAVAFLPLVLKNFTPGVEQGIHGRVTENGNSVAGVPLDLRFYDGSSYSSIASTATRADGSYLFAGIPSLGSGERYRVVYLNASGTPGRLSGWSTWSITSYTAGTNLQAGDFDIADIALVSPPDGATVSLPRTFSWTPRPATPADDYELDLYDGEWWWTDPTLGYVGEYTLNSLPSGFYPGTGYWWEVWVYGPHGYGWSYEARAVTFSNTGASAAASALPARRVPPEEMEDSLARR